MVYLIVACVIAVIMLFPNDNNILLSSIYVRYGSVLLAIVMAFLIIISSAMIYKSRENLHISWLNAILTSVFLILFALFLHGSMPKTKMVASGSLYPYLRSGDIVVYADSPITKQDGLVVVKDAINGRYSVGYLLASGDDKIGAINGIPVICKNSNESAPCFTVTDVCAFLLGQAVAMGGKLSNSSLLAEDEIVPQLSPLDK